MKPTVLMVGRTRYRLPLGASLARKFDALEERLDLRVLAAAPRDASAGDGTFSLQRGTPVARSTGRSSTARCRCGSRASSGGIRRTRSSRRAPTRRSRRSRGGRLARSAAAVVVEIHGDWRTWSRLYGSPARAVVAPLADRAALVAIRRADAVRTLSSFTSRIVQDAGVEPAGTFTTYTELTAFSEPPPVPLPDRPVALFVGVLERYKNVHAIADAWRLAAPRVPGATLRIVGDGRHRDVVEGLLRDLPGRVTWDRRLETPAMVRALDDAWLLLLASRSEGTPRVVLEALCRGRAVVGARAGGIPDVVSDDETRAARRPGPARGDRRRARPDPLRSCARRASRRRRARARPPMDVHRGRIRRPRRRARRRAPSRRDVDEEADRRHPAGRPGERGARGDGPEAARARRAGRGARRAHRLRRRGCAARQRHVQDASSASRRARRGMRFESALARELSRRPRPSAVLAHMCPIYAVLAAPLARPTGVRCCSGSRTGAAARSSRLATRASSKVLSVDARTFPIKTRKLVAIGHGIDVSDLPCVKRPEDASRYPPGARPDVAREGARHDPPRGRAGARGAAPHRRAVPHRGGACAPDRARSARDRARPCSTGSTSAARCRDRPSRRSTPTSTRSSTTCARAPRTRSSTRRPRRACR